MTGGKWRSEKERNHSGRSDAWHCCSAAQGLAGPVCSLVPTQLFPHNVYSTAVFSSTFLLLLCFFVLGCLLNFFGNFLSYFLEGVCWLLLPIGCFSWGHSVWTETRQPLTVFAPDFIKNSGPYSVFPPIHSKQHLSEWYSGTLRGRDKFCMAGTL